jgi:hypothetical protein
MSSTYSTNLAIELIGAGEQAGNWGSTTNTNLGTLLEQAISGYTTQGVVTGTDTTLAMTNGASATARNMFIELTGSGGASTNLIVPANKKLYFIYNNTSSGQVTVKVSGQTGVSVPNGAKTLLISNGTDIVDATNYMTTLTAGTASVTGTLGVAGTTTLTGASVLTGAVSGAGINAYLASPPAIGGTAAAAGSFTTVAASSTMTAVGAISSSGASVGDLLGNVRNIPQTSKSAPYTLVAADNGQCVVTNSGVTVPASVFAVNNVVTIYNNSGSSITITQGSGMTLQWAGQNTSTTGSRTLALFGISTVLFLSASSAVITGVGMT